MTLQQLEYILAVDAYRHFSSAAEHCFVTQPTLSAMIRKLEDELGEKIFDRSKQPVVPTEIGGAIIGQARKVVQEAARLEQMVHDQRETLVGELRIGIIPTLAPYLLPLFLRSLSEKATGVNLIIADMTTQNIIQNLKKDLLDVGIMATPTQDPLLFEEPLFYEELVVYAPHEKSLLDKRYVLSEDLDINRLVLLEEGHCIRTQVINLCALQKAQNSLQNITYEAGSLETLQRLVESHSGITILPQLALLNFDEGRMQNIRFFKPPAPVREISIVTNRAYAKKRMTRLLKKEILDNLPDFMKEEKLKNVLGIYSDGS